MKKLVMMLVAMLTTVFSTFAKETPGLITLVNGKTIECADIDQNIIGNKLKYKLVPKGEVQSIPANDVKYYQYYVADGDSTVLGVKTLRFKVCSAPKFMKSGEVKIQDTPIWGTVVYEGYPASLVMVQSSTYNGKAYIMTYDHFVYRDDWGHGISLLEAHKNLAKKAMGRYMAKIFPECPELKSVLEEKGIKGIYHFWDNVKSETEGYANFMIEFNNCIKK